METNVLRVGGTFGKTNYTMRPLTLLVVKFLEDKCADEEGTWALVVEKARGWLVGLGQDQAALEELEKKALEIVQKSPVTGGYDDADDR